MKERRNTQPLVVRCKLVLVGDVQCGKTAMLQVLAKDCYPEVCIYSKMLLMIKCIYAHKAVVYYVLIISVQMIERGRKKKKVVRMLQSISMRIFFFFIKFSPLGLFCMHLP